jgi:hypothetical protein
MTNETKSREGKSRDWTAFAVFVVFAANAATAFAIQAWMTYGFGAKVWGMPVPLCAALIVALDVFAIMFMVLTYLLRGTGWPRGAAMGVFLFAIGAQVFAAEQFAEFEHWPTSVRWFSALPAIFLALAQEGVILWRTHRADEGRGKAPDRVKREVPPAPAKPRAVNEAPVTQRPPRSDKIPAAPPVSSGKTPKAGMIGRRGRAVDPSEQERRDLIAASVLDGTDKKTAANSAGVSVRSVENWIASYRERHPEPAPQGEQFDIKTLSIVPAKPADQQERPEIAEEVTA